jgi:hypothetical protein
MLVDTISEYQFIGIMTQDQNGFSYEGSKALFEYYEDFEEDIPFDPVAIRCDFNEYENLQAIKEDYQDIETIEDLQNHTTVIEIPNSDRLIIQAY